MAYVDDLIASVQDPQLRRALATELSRIKERTSFGLVFERHIPETGLLPGVRPRPGAVVALRRDPERVYMVEKVSKRRIVIRPRDGGESLTVDADELFLLATLGNPIFPALTSVKRVERGGDRPFHSVINGENYHALQLFTYMFAGQVDCIYIDPPYNTGARDWKYNNRYVDKHDVWRHSKWLSFMEKRLRLSGRLLKADGVLIVTVDANEVHHLGLLLEQLFPAARRQVVTICINPSGASGEGLSRVDEYAIFCFFGGAQPVVTLDDMLTTSTAARSKVRWEALMRGGTEWYRAIRRNLCYPVLLDSERQKIVGVGPPLPDDVADADRPAVVEGHPAAWPVRDDRRLGIWRVDGKRLMELAGKGYAYVSSEDNERGTWTIRYLLQGTITAIERGEIKPNGRGPRGQVVIHLPEPKRVLAKTMWNRGRHTAGGAGGSIMLVNLLGERGAFPFPKSVYAVRDCLEAAVGNRPSALILDFFAGAGTTMHAAALMNLDDGGRRRTIMVTNNEVGEDEARVLRRRGAFPGDADYEARGIFEHVTKPRVTAAISGMRPDGTPAEGTYLDGRQCSEGFDENVEFFRLDYLNKDDVELGKAFEAISPCLWLMSGGQGSRRIEIGGKGWALAEGGAYAVLFDETRLRGFKKAVSCSATVRRVFLVTDSEEAYSEMAEALGGKLPTSMLYRDYLRNFQINTSETQ
ncbi:MAG: site-specific DNA-methyltransferase [Actinomycetota bacterium]|nr:site-specific DNA-methyltransferase [Actinomycetota bacterium]